MKNRQSARRRQSRPRNQKSEVSPVKFHLSLFGTLSGVTGNSTLSVNPQSITGLSEVGDQFDLFHCRSLRYRLHPMPSTNTGAQIAAYVPDIDTQTLTGTQLSESPLSAMQVPWSGVPSRWINVPRAALKGMLDWYKCTPDSGAAEFESQGKIIIAGGLSETFALEFEGVLVFKNPISSSLQFERTIDRAVQKGVVVRIPIPTPK